LEEQKEIIRRLIQCSTELSDFIKTHIKIQDVIGIVAKKTY